MMKIALALLLLVNGVGAADIASLLGRTVSETDPIYVKFNLALQDEACASADRNSLTPEGMEAWQDCKIHIVNKLSGNEERRELNVDRELQFGSFGEFGPNDDRDGELSNGTSADFLEPCYPLPEQPQARLDANWTTMDFADDGTYQFPLGFDFKMYGTTHNIVQVDANGALTFGPIHVAVPFISANFPNPMMDMVAPYWSDVDVRPGAGAGTIWWKNFGDHLAVVWDAVGFANGANPTNKRNTFQVVISDGRVAGRLGPSNVCFCYIDMDWWRGAFHLSDFGFGEAAAATVGLSSVNDLTSYVQVGRFGKTGDDYDGPFGAVDGVDWLDYQGSNLKRSADQVDPVQGLCFQTGGEDANIPPVPSGFPLNDTYTVPCRGKLDLSLSFATPEANQFILLQDPANIGDLQALGLSYVRTEVDDNEHLGAEVITVTLDWSPDFAAHSGNYELVFVASDNLGANITKTLKILVAQCGSGEDVPTMCVPIEGNTCTEGDPQPFCTPFRSPEHCPMDESFPTYIRARQDIIRENPETLDALGYWFQLLQDKSAAFAFTASSGYHAPKILCCADPVDWMTTCAAELNGTSFVVRAVGDHHSNSAVYVLPNGLGGMELSRPLPSLTAEQLNASIAGLLSPPTKIIVEEFISASTTEPALPDEYKIHAFNGTVGSMSMVLNRNSDCACYAEVDQDWNRLDRNGCFAPNMPFGQEGEGNCYATELDKGAKRPFPMKGHDLCGILPLIQPSCLLGELVRIAQEISLLIGVYVRIDFFVSGDNKIFIQEYTFNHNNGLRHCSSKVDDDTGCIDSCFLGRMWKNNAFTEDERTMGGPVTALPPVFAGFSAADLATQCTTATSTSLPAVHASCS